MPIKSICFFNWNDQGAPRFFLRMVFGLVLMLAVCRFAGVNICLAQENSGEKKELPGDTIKKDIASDLKKETKDAKEQPANPEKDRDPMVIPDEIERRMGDVEPPEVRITGIIDAGGKKAAIAELNLENYKGVVMFEPGMTVSIPRPDRTDTVSNRWMTPFTVTDVTNSGVLITLENGEKVWFPLMGEKK
jgi:hypothetical protein